MAIISDLVYVPSGQIVATGVSAEDYEAHYAEQRCEWVNGTVIRMTPAKLRHNLLIHYLGDLVGAYFEFRPIGTLVPSPFVMRLDALKARREPDLMVILNSNPHTLTDTYLDGAADICIEVLSDESSVRDRGEKYNEYEQGGVKEYWLFDPDRKESFFYRLNREGVYQLQAVDGQGNYRTPLLPDLALHVPTLWAEKLPGPVAISQYLDKLLNA
jgi:Uma2 family endonuclease